VLERLILKDVFWIGGSPCAGKSSISNILADNFNLNVYRVDQAFETHIQHFDSELHPTLVKWCRTSWNERWTQPVERLVQEVIACYREHFTLILEDVFAMPKDKPLLIEGTALLPKEVTNVQTNCNQSVWIIPTAEFQTEHYAKREWAHQIVEQCDDAQSAFQNWMQRDIQFAKWVRAEAETLGCRVIIVDGKQSIEDNAVEIAGLFGLKKLPK
jgi:2-phosphoglycerate kinase